jgi:GxxExxY protein
MWLVSSNGWFGVVHHRGTENTDNSLSGAAIGAAIAVHRYLGPGLLESVYQECLAHELKKRQISFAREVPVALQYENHALRSRLQLDFLIEERLIIEVKSVVNG